MEGSMPPLGLGLSGGKSFSMWPLGLDRRTFFLHRMLAARLLA